MSRQVVAVFDFDGTLTTKDTFVEFIKFAKGAMACYAGFALFAPLLLAMKCGLYPNWKVKQQVFCYFFKGTALVQFNKWGQEFAASIDELRRPEAIAALRRHQADGDTVMIVSASMENWIAPWAKAMGIHQTLATGIAVDAAGNLTGHFATKNCHGAEKCNRLLAVLPNREAYVLIAYGDSAGDKEMLALADQGFYRKFN